jgi:hypothetical protein
VLPSHILAFFGRCSMNAFQVGRTTTKHWQLRVLAKACRGRS